MSEVVTTLTIDADTRGADDYSQKMDQAASSAKGFYDTQKESALAMAGVATAVIGAIAAGNQFLDYIGKANRDLADLDSMAHRVGMSLGDLQGLQFGAMIAGLNPDHINQGLQRSAELLNDASRNSNSLSKELATNGLNIRNANGSLITQNQLLGMAADLVARARNPGDQEAIAKMLGFTKDWVPLLQQGSAAMVALTDEARNAGAVIDDETIKRAAEFDAKWRKSSVEFSMNLKAAIAEVLPVFDDMIDRSLKFVRSLDRAKIEQAAQQQLSALNAPIGLPEDDFAIKIEATPETQRAIDKIANAGSVWEAVTAALEGAFRFVYTSDMHNPPYKLSRVDPAALPGYAASRITEPSYPTASQMDAAFDRANPVDPGSRARPLAGLSPADYEAENFSKVASAARDANDRVDGAINTLRRHTEQQIADTAAIGVTVSALAQLRAALARQRPPASNDNTPAAGSAEHAA